MQLYQTNKPQIATNKKKTEKKKQTKMQNFIGCGERALLSAWKIKFLLIGMRFQIIRKIIILILYEIITIRLHLHIS